MLKAEGSYVLPKNVPANEFLNLEGQKISTSKNWAVWLPEYLKDFPNKQDVLRYVLTSNAPESKDNDFTWKDFQAKNNNELVAIFGNFINRVVVLTNKYYEGFVPNKNELIIEDIDTINLINKSILKINKSLKDFKFRESCNELINISRIGNKYLADQEPWKLIKVDEKRVETIMYVSLQISAILSIFSEPFLPVTSKKLKVMLNSKSHDSKWVWHDGSNSKSFSADNFLLKSGIKINKAELLFSKIEDSEIDFQIKKLNKAKKSKDLSPIKNEISYNDFSKLELKVGSITHAEKVPKTKKLLSLKVDMGDHNRTIVSGIAKSYSTNEIIGQKVVVLTNLDTKIIAGVKSQGMILLTRDENDNQIFIQPDSTKIPDGLKIS
jgi:methionyl-tRNA synthetase